jgi:hypothetical protein
VSSLRTGGCWLVTKQVDEGGYSYPSQGAFLRSRVVDRPCAPVATALRRAVLGRADRWLCAYGGALSCYDMGRASVRAAALGQAPRYRSREMWRDNKRTCHVPAPMSVMGRSQPGGFWPDGLDNRRLSLTAAPIRDQLKPPARLRSGSHA